MFNKIDYTQVPLETLQLEEAKAKKNASLAAGLIGFSVAVMVYGIVRNGFGFLYIAIPLCLVAVFYKSSQVQKQNLEEIQKEIAAKKTG